MNIVDQFHVLVSFRKGKRIGKCYIRSRHQQSVFCCRLGVPQSKRIGRHLLSYQYLHRKSEIWILPMMRAKFCQTLPASWRKLPSPKMKRSTYYELILKALGNFFSLFQPLYSLLCCSIFVF